MQEIHDFLKKRDVLSGNARGRPAGVRPRDHSSFRRSALHPDGQGQGRLSADED